MSLRFLFLLWCVLSLWTFAWATQDPQLAYEKGDFAKAAEGWRTQTANAAAPGTLHNLGNAEYRLGRIGPAILAWERAHALSPSFRNTTANLRFARGQAGLDQPETAWHETYASLLAPDRWIWLATLAFWTAVALLALPALSRQRRRAWSQITAVLAIVAFLLTLPALAGLMSRGKFGVIVAADTQLHLTPTQESEALGSLPEGELARLEKTRGDYCYVRASSDRAGWVRRAEFTKIWP
jgi:hypothetical protein